MSRRDTLLTASERVILESIRDKDTAAKIAASEKQGAEGFGWEKGGG